MAAIAVGMGLLDFYDNISFFGYLFLFVTLFIFLKPFIGKKDGFDFRKVDYYPNRGYLIICVFYILCSAITLYRYVPEVIQLVKSGNWSLNRLNLYNDDIVFPYHNFLEYCAMQATDYLRLLVLIVAFSTIRTGQHKKVCYLTIFAAFSSMLVSAIYTSARGTIINSFVLMGSLFLYFSSGYSKKAIRLIIVVSIVAICLLIPYFISVTMSRFGSGGGLDSIISYMGQAPVVFNSGVFTINKYMFGEYAFGVLFNKTIFRESSIGGTWDTGFYTFVGWLFIDWGPIGTVIIGVLINAILKFAKKKKRFNISDIYLLLFYFSMLQQGVFVIGRNYCYTIVFTLTIYVFLKVFFEKVDWSFFRPKNIKDTNYARHFNNYTDF